MHAFTHPALSGLAAFGVLLFFIGTFALPSGYSYGGAVLLLTSLWMLTRKTFPALARSDRTLLWTLLIYSGVMVAMVLFLHNKSNEIDRSLRALLAIPILWLLLRVPVRAPLLWMGILSGAVVAAGQAWWETVVLALPRAKGFLNIIHYSNIALVYAACCVAGLVWVQTQARYRRFWQTAFLIGLACALYSSVMGASRGSWVAFPAILALFAVALFKRRHLTYWLIGLGIGVATLAFLFSTPDNPLSQRYAQAVHDITLYQQQRTYTSIGARFEMWRAAWINVMQKPLLGWNVQDYDVALHSLVEQGRVSKTALAFDDNVHNGYLQAWVFAGLPGLLVLLALYGVPLWLFARKVRDPNPSVQAFALCGASLTAGYVCFSLTQPILKHNNGIMFFVLALVIFWAALRHAQHQASATTST